MLLNIRQPCLLQHVKVRHRYTTGRNVLRHILSAYLPEFSPERIPLKRNPHGKLFVPPETHHLKFNVAHTNDVYVVAVARSREVGIDIESVGRTLKNVPALSWRWLHPSEAEKVGSSGVDFLASWVRKEAYVKALGLGISRGDLKSFRFNEDGQVIDRGDPRDWSFHEFSVISREHITDDATPRLSRNYIGCVALQGIDAKIDAWWTVGDADAQTAH